MSFLNTIASKWRSLATVILIFLLFIIVVLEERREVEYVREKLLNVSFELEALKKAHMSLTEKEKTSQSNLKPSEAYERLRRNMYSKTKELWQFIRKHWPNTLHGSSLKYEKKLHKVLEEIRQKRRSLLSDIEQLSEQDGWNEWRQRRADEVSDLVQRRLYQLQNPSNCLEAKKLTCAYSKNCDFGCQLHHIAYCISFAFAMERTLILKSDRASGWESMFNPISDTCISTYGDKVVELSSSFKNTSNHPWHTEVKFSWQKPASDGGKPITEYVLQYRHKEEEEWKTGTSVAGDQLTAVQDGLIPGLVYEFTVSAVNMAGRGNPSNVFTFVANYKDKVISLPIKESKIQEGDFLPIVVPVNLAQRAMRFNGDPASWWVGQVLKYILKPRPDMQAAINKIMTIMNFTTPIVGVHIHRTDDPKNVRHEIEEYMTQVQDYYDKLEISQLVDVRRVYLVSEDPKMLDNARTSYPTYEFLGVPRISMKKTNQYSIVSMAEELVDLHMLAKCDYIVCTFSSQMGRVAYELMQANKIDASNNFYSLDDIYYFGRNKKQ